MGEPKIVFTGQLSLRATSDSLLGWDGERAWWRFPEDEDWRAVPDDSVLHTTALLAAEVKRLREVMRLEAQRFDNSRELLDGRTRSAKEQDADYWRTCAWAMARRLRKEARGDE